MPNRDVSQPYTETNDAGLGRPHHAEDEPDRDGYDDSQRAEIAEVEGEGPSDGIILTDMTPDMGEDLEEE